MLLAATLSDLSHKMRRVVRVVAQGRGAGGHRVIDLMIRLVVLLLERDRRRDYVLIVRGLKRMYEVLRVCVKVEVVGGVLLVRFA